MKRDCVNRSLIEVEGDAPSTSGYPNCVRTDCDLGCYSSLSHTLLICVYSSKA